MSEINNNIHNYGYKIDRIETKKDEKNKSVPDFIQEEDECRYVPDTGVLGRSLINSPNNINITRCVDEAVDMAENQPVRLRCSEAIFDSGYEKYKNSGLSDADAYLAAITDEEEFLDISNGYKK